MRSLFISCPSERLAAIDLLTLNVVQAQADGGGTLIWERDGRRGKVTNTALRDYVTTYLVYQELQRRGRIETLPDAVVYLPWVVVEPAGLRPQHGD